MLGELRHHDLVHLSCHRIGRPDAALDSALLMAGDESLTPRDVLGLDPAGSTWRWLWERRRAPTSPHACDRITRGTRSACRRSQLVHCG